MHDELPDVVPLRRRPPRGLADGQAADRAAQVGAVPRLPVVGGIHDREKCNGVGGHFKRTLRDDSSECPLKMTPDPIYATVSFLLAGVLGDVVQVMLGVDRRHAARPGRGHGLPVDVILNVARRKHSGHVRVAAVMGDDVAVGVELDLPFEQRRVRRVANGDEHAVERDLARACRSSGSARRYR